MPSALNDSKKTKVYEFVCRRFLACCSADACGSEINVEFEWAFEKFSLRGLTVNERNYLDIYPYDKWQSTAQLPQFTVGQKFSDFETEMKEGKTTPPPLLSESELISLMDRNGIGTDATMQDHISTIVSRNYAERIVSTAKGRKKTKSAASSGPDDTHEPDSDANAASNAAHFVPTSLGIALIQGYDQIYPGLSKPALRGEVC